MKLQGKLAGTSLAWLYVHVPMKSSPRFLTSVSQRITPDRSLKDFPRIGQGYMHIDNMFLVSLLSVSRGSFQPEIWVAVPPTSESRG